MRTHGAAGREATAAYVEEFLDAMMTAVRKVRKAPKTFKVMGFAPAMAAA